MSFLVDINQYAGPLELLLHIVRREELSLAELPLAKIIDQYIEYLDVLTELAIDDVADFLEIASLLIEMKAKQALPSTDETVEEEVALAEPTEDLVQRLVEYKRIRDASSILEEQGRQWQLRCSRLANDLPPRRIAAGDQPIQPIEIWDLVSAFGRILRQNQPPPRENVIYDDTPIHKYMERIHQLVCSQGKVELTSLFEIGMHKSTLVALFLATLELTRHYGLSTSQVDTGHPLYLVAGENFQRVLDVHQIDNLTFDKVSQSNLPVSPR
ncbi:MAG: segregation/condensation protein A [Planctomycetales bacterium]|nr:segregation/condensation protein A [Planctomycetales bacterium]